MRSKNIKYCQGKPCLEMLSILVFILGAIGCSVWLYFNLTDFSSFLLKKYLVSVAKTAALQVQGEDLKGLQSLEDMSDPEFISLVNFLAEVRENNNDIAYVYIMRQTEQEYVLDFVADADALTSKEDLDLNQNGVIDPEEQKSLLGDKYNMAGIPALEEAFLNPAADEEITHDQWGDLISGYAPIYDENEEVVGILGVDLRAFDYHQAQRRGEIAMFLSVFTLGLISIVIGIVLRQYWKRIKNLQELDKQKYDFIALASHQLRTPLSITKWCLGTLRPEDLPKELSSEQIEAVNNLCKVNDRMTNLVNDFLKVAKAESRELEVKSERIELYGFCQEIIKELQILIVKYGIKFDLEIDPKLSYIRSDPGLLREILNNLLANAIKYTPAGKEVKLKIYSAPDKIYFKIIDQGLGIPQEEQSRVFSKFFRASNAQRKEPNGTGLGLYFVKQIVELLGGEISFNSIEGQGSEFYFYLFL